MSDDREAVEQIRERCHNWTIVRNTRVDLEAQRPLSVLARSW